MDGGDIRGVTVNRFVEGKNFDDEPVRYLKSSFKMSAIFSFETRASSSHKIPGLVYPDSEWEHPEYVLLNFTVCV